MGVAHGFFVEREYNLNEQIDHAKHRFYSTE